MKCRFFREINVFLGKVDKNKRELVQESRCGPAAAAASPVQVPRHLTLPVHLHAYF